jgi:hypothetical protein
MSDPFDPYAALDALVNRGDVRPFATLMRDPSLDIPDTFRWAIAELLVPTLGAFNVMLVPKRTNAADKQMQKHFRHMKRVAEVKRELKTAKSVEAAIEAAAERLGISTDLLWKHWNVDRALWKTIDRRKVPDDRSPPSLPRPRRGRHSQ